MDDSKAADMQAATAGKVARVSVTERPAAARFNLRIDPMIDGLNWPISA